MWEGEVRKGCANANARVAQSSVKLADIYPEMTRVQSGDVDMVSGTPSVTVGGSNKRKYGHSRSLGRLVANPLNTSAERWVAGLKRPKAVIGRTLSMSGRVDWSQSGV